MVGLQFPSAERQTLPRNVGSPFRSKFDQQSRGRRQHLWYLRIHLDTLAGVVARSITQ
jgi:hypothetical protein